MKNPWVIVGIITVVLFGGAIWFSNISEKQNNEGVTVTDQIKGNPEATVTLVEYSDFQCPACASFQPVLNTLLEEYGDKLRFEYRHFPLPMHQFAMQAAVAAEAAGQQGKFFEYHDALFLNQDQWSKSTTPSVFFVQYAKDLGLDVEKFERHMKSSLLRDAVREDMEAARGEGLTGTPTFFLNGERMQMETFDDFIAQIVVKVDPEAAALLNASTTATSSETTSGIKFGI